MCRKELLAQAIAYLFRMSDRRLEEQLPKLEAACDLPALRPPEAPLVSMLIEVIDEKL